MGTRWKNNSKLIIWSILFSFGISGIFFFFGTGLQYTDQDFFHTPQFQSDVDDFSNYLSLFELNNVPLEEAKKTITVTEEDINEHRYRYGTLPEQIDNITAQYMDRIQEAKDTGNDELEKNLTAERDGKIEDIKQNFSSDEHVRPKVIKEKEQKLEKYYKQRETHRTTYLWYKDAFQYNFKNNATGQVFTNVKNNEKLTENNTLFLTTMSISREQAINYLGLYEYESLSEYFFPKNSGVIEGQIAVAKNVPESNMFIKQNEDYKRMQIISLIYVLSALLSLLLSVIFIKKSKGIQSELAGWSPYYNKLPIDVRGIFNAASVLGVIVSMMVVADQVPNLKQNPYFNGLDLFFCILIAAFFVGITYVQWKLIIPEVKNWNHFKEVWARSISIRVWRWTKGFVKESGAALHDAFLEQSTGTQMFLLMGAVFTLGLSAIMVIFHPVFLLFYVLLLAIAGIPLVMFFVKKIGYFNRIVGKTSELAAGNMGQDLEISGRSILARLAENINVLREGVKISQNEQAKSERLKTELVTNVSHDLRTPLTSIITYTELLKTEELTPEDRAAYLAIIDRKSQRLKVLIDDLFEVSKMASGNIELNKEKVDLVQLLQQALAEHDDRINESNLQFRMTHTDQPINALVDGQKLWRVFDNLIGNILKYSLENSRVYIHITKENGQAIITFKNVSKYELNQYSDELVERFKRGDTSRHTEGSGLGLAIAKSIVDLHEGSLDIETDGDLFKVKITLGLEE